MDKDTIVEKPLRAVPVFSINIQIPQFFTIITRKDITPSFKRFLSWM